VDRLCQQERCSVVEADMALKPLFYMLAKHGPWFHHVRVPNILVSTQVEQWLIETGRVEFKDFEVLTERIETKNTKKASLPTPMAAAVRWRDHYASIEPIIFFNDPTIATYVKLTWGGR
jgi:hypothetical protein